MKKTGLFLLAVVMVAGCGDVSTDTTGAGHDTVVIIGIDDSCTGKFYTATGRVSSVNTSWVSGEFSIQPNQNIRIVLPSRGQYRVYISHGNLYWDYTYDLQEGVEKILRFWCD